MALSACVAERACPSRSRLAVRLVEPSEPPRVLLHRLMDAAHQGCVDEALERESRAASRIEGDRSVRVTLHFGALNGLGQLS